MGLRLFYFFKLKNKIFKRFSHLLFHLIGSGSRINGYHYSLTHRKNREFLFGHLYQSIYTQEKHQ